MWVLCAIVVVTRIFSESGTNAPCAMISICVKNVKQGGWWVFFDAVEAVCCWVFIFDAGVILTPYFFFFFVHDFGTCVACVAE